jgi:germination protein M
VKGALVVALAVGVLAAACGTNEEATPTETGTTTAPVETTTLPVYFLRDGKVWPVARSYVDGQNLTFQALSFLANEPTRDETTKLGLSTGLSAGWNARASTDSGVLKVELGGKKQPISALAQIVYTLSALPGVSSVVIDGTTYTAADFEDQTPAILVEAPLSFEEVSSPLRVTGTANTFEATFNYELMDSSGKVVDENFVTATSGTGTRGTFDFTTKPFDDLGSLVVFERSAEDGSRINVVEIPLKKSE